MSKKKEKSKKHQKNTTKEGGCCGVIGISVPAGLLDALEFAEDLGDVLDMIQCAKEEPDVPDEAEAEAEMEDMKASIFDLMTEDELKAYDLIDNFVHSPNIGLPEVDTIDSRIEHADWNTEDYRAELKVMMASFEAFAAYYAYLRDIGSENDEVISGIFEEIQQWLEEMVFAAKELEILVRIEELELTMDRASVELNDAYEERDILQEQLEALYTECDCDDCEDEDDSEEGDN